jgi:flagellar biosynthesis/type III secretory pathway chaperone
MLLDPAASPATAHDLQERLRQCRILNLATGGAIVSARRDNDQALKLLGHEAAPQAYEAQGHSSTHLPSRTLGRA